MRYADFEGYPINIENWGGTMKLYISDTCSYTLSSTNEHVLKYAYIRYGKTVTVDAETLASWESRAEDGYFYVRVSGDNSYFTFGTEKPEI
jgi:hypothetical protein